MTTEKWTEIILVNEDTGERHSYGMLVNTREIGPLAVCLTYDEHLQAAGERGVWWIIVHDRERDKKAVIGFRASRRYEAWMLYLGGDVDELRDSVDAEPVIGSYNPKTTTKN